jgi:DNA repair photolyase
VRWSLKPEETLGLIFWTRAPGNLIADAHLFRDFKVKIHMTVTGWHEVEKGAPSLREGAHGLRRLVDTFGPDNVSWRFSPVPMVDDVRERFSEILEVASGASLKSVYLSFLQPNDRMPETRKPEDRRALLGELADMAGQKGIEVRLCNEDRLLANAPPVPNLCSGVCAPPQDFELEGRSIPDAEGCGCVYMVDPFSINEACAFGCQFCYTADKSSANHKRNTTKPILPVIQP